MSKKVVVIEDYSVRGGRMRFYDFLKKDYGAQVVYVKDLPEIGADEFNGMFLKMETQGPDVLPVNQDILEAMSDAHIVISHISAISSEAVNKAKNLEAICIMRSGVENVNVPNAVQKGVKIINTPGRLAISVSEFTIGLMVSEMKNIARSHEKVMKGAFVRTFHNSSYSCSLCGKYVGLIGFGAIGKRTAGILSAMEANVLVFDPYVPREQIKKMGYTPVSLNELCRKADVISVHYRLTPETERLIGKEQFELMKPHCFFINTARAGLVDEPSLIDALVNDKIGGAGLDVFHQEPLPPEHPFLKLENVTLTAHLAGTGSDNFEITLQIMEGALRRYFESGQWINTVN
ncbi:MAG: 2-hydroxyacid dehydrogenase [Christensenellales bacterium]|jgi:D-3-phosphoglycerate dehydrogenase